MNEQAKTLARRFGVPFAVDLRKRRTWFSDEDGSESDDKEENEEQEKKPEQDDPAFMTKRLNRERAKILKNLGLEGLDISAAAEQIKALQALQREKQTDTEKQAADLKEANEKALRLERELEELRTKERTKTLRDTVRAAADKENALSAKAVSALAETDYADDYAALIDEDGAINEKGLTALIAKIKKDDKTLFSEVRGSNSNSDGTPKNPTRNPKEKEERQGMRSRFS